MEDVNGGLAALADHLQARRGDILRAWREAIARDPALTTSDAQPRIEIYDHMPALLSTFEQRLRMMATGAPVSNEALGQAPAAAHGLQRWQQGYDLREVTRELGKLNEIVVAELEDFRFAEGSMGREARRLWASLCGTGIEESVGQYFQLQQQEAAGHVADLESALHQFQQLEQQRADLWRQAAHDLRGNLGVVANATVGLTQGGLPDTSRDTFVRILMRNLTALHHLLNDVTDLARLQAGREERRIDAIDISLILQHLCEGIRPLAQERHLFLRCDGPQGFAVDGDEVKIRRIAQNLVLNAVKFTRNGGITVAWGDSAASDPKRWELCVKDTGPGLHGGSDEPLAQALEKAQQQSVSVENAHTDNAHTEGPQRRPKEMKDEPPSAASHAPEPIATGEGLGLSIVKRLCDMLDAKIEMTSEEGVGTTFRILFPRHYPA